MSKKRILIDFDNTIANSSECIVRMMQWKNRYNPNTSFYYNPSEILWDFSPYAKTEEDKKWCLSQFTSQKFYDNLDLIEGCKEVLEELHKDYEIIICSKKCKEAMEMCMTWIQNNLEKGLHYDSVIFVSGFNDKSYIKADIIIDDRLESLDCENKDIAIHFGNYGYNQLENLTEKDNEVLTKWWISKIYVADTWKEVLGLIRNNE